MTFLCHTRQSYLGYTWEGDELHQKNPFSIVKEEHSHYLKHFYTISLHTAYEKQMLNVGSYNTWYGE